MISMEGLTEMALDCFDCNSPVEFRPTTGSLNNSYQWLIVSPLYFRYSLPFFVSLDVRCLFITNNVAIAIVLTIKCSISA